MTGMVYWCVFGVRKVANKTNYHQASFYWCVHAVVPSLTFLGLKQNKSLHVFHLCLHFICCLLLHRRRLLQRSLPTTVVPVATLSSCHCQQLCVGSMRWRTPSRSLETIRKCFAGRQWCFWMKFIALIKHSRYCCRPNFDKTQVIVLSVT